CGRAVGGGGSWRLSGTGFNCCGRCCSRRSSGAASSRSARGATAATTAGARQGEWSRHGQPQLWARPAEGTPPGSPPGLAPGAQQSGDVKIITFTRGQPRDDDVVHAAGLEGLTDGLGEAHLSRPPRACKGKAPAGLSLTVPAAGVGVVGRAATATAA